MGTISVILPFFAVIGLGHLAARCRLLPLESVPGLNAFVLYIALPAMLFQFGANTPVAQLLDPTTIGVWLVSGLLLLALVVAVGLRGRRGWLDSSFGGLIAVLSNSGFMGLPLIVALRGESASGPIVTTLLVDIVAVQSIALALSQQGRGGGALSTMRVTLRRVLGNPMPWAIILGTLWGSTGAALFGPLDQLLHLLASAATPVALFTIGAVLARRPPTPTSGAGALDRTLTADVCWLAAVKLLLHPALVGALGAACITAGLPLQRGDLLVLVLVAALPAAANAVMLAERLRADSRRVASVVLVTTVVGLVTFTAAAVLL